MFVFWIKKEYLNKLFRYSLSLTIKLRLVFAMAATIAAATVAIVFIVKLKSQSFAAVWTFDFAFVQNTAVDADFFIAVWAFYFIDVFVAAAVAVIVVAAAIVVIFVIAIELIFKGAEILINSLDFFIEFRGAVFQVGYCECHVIENIENCLHDLTLICCFINADSFNKTFEVCYFFC